MARHLIHLDGEIVAGSCCTVDDDARPLRALSTGTWETRLPDERPPLSAVRSTACATAKWAVPWDQARSTVQQLGDDGVWRWLYNTQGVVVSHEGFHWSNTMPTGTPNVWAPGVAGWRKWEADENGRAIWLQPTGAYDAYPTGFQVVYTISSGPPAQRTRLFESLIPANTTTPGSDDRWWQDLGVA